MRLNRHFERLAKDIVVYGLFTSLTQLSGILLLPLLTRSLSQFEYGALDMIALVATLIGIFTRLLLPSAFQRYLHEYKECTHRLFSTLMICTVGVGAGVFWVMFYAAPHICNALFNSETYSEYLLAGVFGAILAAISALPETLIRMQRKIVQYNVVQLSYTITYLSLAIFLTYYQNIGIKGVYIALVAAELVKLTTVLALTSKHIRISFDKDILLKSLVYSLPMIPSVLISWANLQLDRFFLNHFISTETVAIYSAGAKISGAIMLLTLVFQKAWHPFIMGMLDIEKKEMSRFISTSLRHYISVFCVIGICIFLMSPEIIDFLIPQEYSSSRLLIPFLIGSAILTSSGNISGIGIMIAEKTHLYSVAAAMGFTVNIIFTVPMILNFGMLGAVMGTFLSACIYSWQLTKFSRLQSGFEISTSRPQLTIALYLLISILFIFTEQHAPLGFHARSLLCIFSIPTFFWLSTTPDERSYISDYIRNKLRPN